MAADPDEECAHQPQEQLARAKVVVHVPKSYYAPKKPKKRRQFLEAVPAPRLTPEDEERLAAQIERERREKEAYEEDTRRRAAEAKMREHSEFVRSHCARCGRRIIRGHWFKGSWYGGECIGYYRGRDE